MELFEVHSVDVLLHGIFGYETFIAGTADKLSLVLGHMRLLMCGQLVSFRKRSIALVTLVLHRIRWIMPQHVKPQIQTIAVGFFAQCTPERVRIHPFSGVFQQFDAFVKPAIATNHHWMCDLMSFSGMLLIIGKSRKCCFAFCTLQLAVITDLFIFLFYLLN